MDIIWFVGFVTCVYITIFCSKGLWNFFRGFVLTKLGFVKDFHSYGKWAIVTGATDGIGREYAKQLANKGLNIVLISRTLSKLKELACEIETETSMETKIVVFDFVKDHDYGCIERELINLDVGILVNNVGMSYGSTIPFHESDMRLVSDIITCNVFSDVTLSNIVLKGMIKRKRGAIVHVSSATIFLDVALANVYSSTKSFMQKFTKSLQLENAGVVDHQLVVPMYVATKLSKMKPTFTIPTAEQYVQQAIRSIGILEVTCGYWSHEVLSFIIIYFVPQSVTSFVFKKIRAKRLKVA